jgi:hypothetical protein
MSEPAIVEIITREYATVEIVGGTQGPPGPPGNEVLGEKPIVISEPLEDNDMLQFNASEQHWMNVGQELITDGGNF